MKGKGISEYFLSLSNHTAPTFFHRHWCNIMYDSYHTFILYAQTFKVIFQTDRKHRIGTFTPISVIRTQPIFANTHTHPCIHTYIPTHPPTHTHTHKYTQRQTEIEGERGGLFTLNSVSLSGFCVCKFDANSWDVHRVLHLCIYDLQPVTIPE